MSRKQKYTVIQKVKACKDFISGKKSAIEISRDLEMGKYGHSLVYTWVNKYNIYGSAAFESSNKNKSYTKEFKLSVIKEYLKGGTAIEDLSIKYNIPSINTIAQWIKKYNNHIEIEDYKPSPEVYMANTLKTTLEERIEIVKYCLDHNRDIKGTAAHFNGQYAQIRNWVIKYEQYGEDGLIDKRGKRKDNEELTDTERLIRENKRLKELNELKDKEIEVLKKDEALGKSYLGNLPRARKIYLKHQNKIKQYELIKKLSEEELCDVSLACKVLKIGRSSYYKWLNHKPSNREKEDKIILSKIEEISKSNNSMFGCSEMFMALRNQYGFTCGHNRVYRLMCSRSIVSTYRAKPKHYYPKVTPEETAENILDRQFSVSAPNEVYCSDVTEVVIPETGEKMFMSPAIDLYDRFPVAFIISKRNDSKLANDTLDSAHEAYPDATPLYHTDRGFAYTRAAFKAKLEGYGMKQSMSRVGRCIDNCVCEGFQGQFKDMMNILYPKARTEQQVINAINGTLDYYINHYPQKRLKGKTCGQVRKEALEQIKNNETITQYPIKKANKYIKYWKDIEDKKQKKIQELLEQAQQAK